LEISYGQLDEQTARLGHHLRTLGVGPDVPVGICLDRSMEMIVGIMAVLKAGGAFLPLDPDYPVERLQFMLSDSKAPIVLTQKSHQALVVGATEGRAVVLCLDELGEVPARPPGMERDSSCAPEDAAYLIYTSGSSGKPKGVLSP